MRNAITRTIKTTEVTVNIIRVVDGAMVTQNAEPIKLVFTGKVNAKTINSKTQEVFKELQGSDIVVKLSEEEKETAYYMSTDTFLKYATLDTSNETEDGTKAEETEQPKADAKEDKKADAKASK